MGLKPKQPVQGQGPPSQQFFSWGLGIFLTSLSPASDSLIFTGAENGRNSWSFTFAPLCSSLTKTLVLCRATCSQLDDCISWSLLPVSVTSTSKFEVNFQGNSLTPLPTSLAHLYFICLPRIQWSNQGCSTMLGMGASSDKCHMMRMTLDQPALLEIHNSLQIPTYEDMTSFASSLQSLINHQSEA